MSEPARTVTIMFTDLVGSTALTNRVGEAPAQALRRAHERILKRQFDRHLGHVVKGTGDGFMVVFASARSAVECGVEVQRAIEREHDEGHYLDLHVRIGVHTGEPVCEGGDYYGRDVNLAARVEAEADGGGVLISPVTWLLSRETPNLVFTLVGERSLKGFDDPIPLFSVQSQAERPATRRTPFIGRAEEAAQLREALEQACRGAGSVVFVTGDAGVGKTRLMSELELVAVDFGMEVLSGVAYEVEGAPPFLPIIEALRHHFAQDNEELLLSDRDRGYLSRLLPGLAHAPSIHEQQAGLDPESERELLFGAINSVFGLLAERRPVMLTLDDVHWADQSTLLYLRHVAQAIGDMPMLVVATYRDFEIDSRHPLRQVLNDVVRRKLARRISLRPFGSDDVAALVEAMLRTKPAAHVLNAVIAATEGNAFYTEELVRQLVDSGHALTDPDAVVAGWVIPDGVRQLIGNRVSRLDAEVHRVLSHASVVGGELPLALVAAVTDSDTITVLDAFEASAAVGVLRESETGFTFGHPLIRETLYDELSAARRRFLHLRVGRAIESTYAGELEAHVAELAHHFYNAGGDGDAERTLAYARRAGTAAAALFAYEDAVLHYSRALEVLEWPGNAAESARSELLLLLGDARWKSGDTAGMRETYARAARSARSAGDAAQFARAALGFGSGEHDFVGEDAELVGLLREALELVDDDDAPLRAALLARLAPALMTANDREGAREVSAEAVAAAQSAGDTATLVRALNARHEALTHPDELPERLAIAKEAVQLVDGLNDKVAAWYTHDWRLTDLLEFGDVQNASAEVAHLFTLAEELRQPQWLGLSKVASTTLALLSGQLEQADQLIVETGDTARKCSAPSLEYYSDVQLFSLRREQGRLGETERIIEQWVKPGQNLGRIARLEAVRFAELDDAGGARATFERVAADDFAQLPKDNVWLYTLCALSEVAAFLGDSGRAEVLYRLLVPYSDRYATFGDVHFAGSVSRFLGKAAASAGNLEAARLHLERGIERDERAGALPIVAYGKYELAKLLLAQRDATAITSLDDARSLARRLGLTALERRAASLTH